MLDFGWAELFVIIAVAVFVIGPDEIPTVMRTLGRLLRRVQYMKYALSRQFDEYVGDDFSHAVNFEALRATQPEGHEEFDEAAEDAELASLEHVIEKEEQEDEKNG